MNTPVIIEKHCAINTGAIILPGTRLEEGVVVSVQTVVKQRCEAWSIYSGNPAKKIMPRSQAMLTLEKQLREQSNNL